MSKILTMMLVRTGKGRYNVLPRTGHGYATVSRDEVWSGSNGWWPLSDFTYFSGKDLSERFGDSTLLSSLRTSQIEFAKKHGIHVLFVDVVPPSVVRKNRKWVLG